MMIVHSIVIAWDSTYCEMIDILEQQLEFSFIPSPLFIIFLYVHISETAYANKIIHMQIKT